jgi:hypothetical protein
MEKRDPEDGADLGYLYNLTAMISTESLKFWFGMRDTCVVVPVTARGWRRFVDDPA